MPRSRDYLNKSDAELQVFTANLYTYATANCARWKVPGPEDFFETLFTEFVAAKTKFEDVNHGKIDTTNKNTAKAALIKALRSYIQGFIARNPLVTDEDKEAMDIPVRDTTPTTHRVPEKRPNTEAIPSGKGRHSVTAINPDTLDKSKPPHVTGVATARRLRKPSDPVSRAEDMPSEFQAGTTRDYDYTEAEYGLIADYATAYENGSGKRGPWSNVTSLLISG